MRLTYVLIFLLAAPAVGLEELWQYDTGCPLPHLPVVMNFDGEPGRCIYLSSRLSDKIHVLKADGELAATFQRPRRVVAGIACSPVLDQLLFEETGGHLVLLNRLRPESYIIEADGLPPENGVNGLAFADINGDRLPEVLRANNHGAVCAYNRRMVPQWQYHAGHTLAGGIAAARVFKDSCGVFLVSEDGAMHGLTGDGRPLWRSQLPPGKFKPGPHRRPLVLQGEGLIPPLVIVTDSEGTVYALRADDGTLSWKMRVGRGDAGTPAVVEQEDGGRLLVVVCEQGATAALDVLGNVVARGALPAGRYVPPPLCADVDDDGEFEILAATAAGAVVVAALDGTVEERLPLPGVASQGMILADIDYDFRLELISVTESGSVVCHKTRAARGWAHPAANPAYNGFAGFESRRSTTPAPAEKHARRSIRVGSVISRDFLEHSPYGGVFVQARLTRKTNFASAVVRREGEIVGATCKPIGGEGLYVPFVQTSSEPVTLDLKLYDESGKLLASSSDLHITPRPVRLVRLSPIEEFLQAVAGRAEAFSTPPQWRLPVVAGKSYWDLAELGPQEPAGPAASTASGQGPPGSNKQAVLARAAKAPFGSVGGLGRYAALNFAFLRGMSRIKGGEPWGVNICTQNGEPFDGAQRPGEPPMPGLRLQTAAYLSGAVFVDRTCEPATKGAFWYGGKRGVPYTPIAFMLPARQSWRPETAGAVATGNEAVEAAMRHAYGRADGRDSLAGSIASGPYGDIFDLFPGVPGSEKLKQYPVVWPLGDFDLKKAGRKALARYVEDGGILVADAGLAGKLRRSVSGVEFTRQTAVGTQVQTALAATAPVDAPFPYRVMKVRDAHTLAWTDAGDPLVAWRPMGRGLVIIGAAEGFTDATRHLLPVAQALLRTLAEAFTPIEIPDNFQIILNRVDDGWVIGAINNNAPSLPGQTAAKPLQANECVIRFKNEAILRFSPQFGRFKWNNAADGLTASLDPGEVGVVHVTLKKQK